MSTFSPAIPLLRSIDRHSEANAGRRADACQDATNNFDWKCTGLGMQPGVDWRSFNSRHTNAPERQISKGEPHTTAAVTLRCCIGSNIVLALWVGGIFVERVLLCFPFKIFLTCFLYYSMRSSAVFENWLSTLPKMLSKPYISSHVLNTFSRLAKQQNRAFLQSLQTNQSDIIGECTRCICHANRTVFSRKLKNA